MWQIIWATMIANLTDVAVGMATFVVAYLSNMAFSTYLNIKVLNQPFEVSKLIDSALKVGTFAVGSALLTIAITTIPIFCNTIGLTIPEEYIEVFSKLAILAITLTAACKYAVEAFGKMKAILSSGTNNTEEAVKVIEEEKAEASSEADLSLDTKANHDDAARSTENISESK